MDSLTPYHLPAILFTLLGVSALLLGGLGMYGFFTYSQEYHYSVNEFDERSSNSDIEVIQFTDLSENSQEVFLETVDRDRYTTTQEPSEFTISKYPDKIYVEYESQTYVFEGETYHNNWGGIVLVAYGFAVGLGAIVTLLGTWCVKSNKFKLPTAVLFGVLTLGLLRQDIVLGVVLLLFSPVLAWVLLWGIERHWDLSFSQRMAQ